jgi:flagellar basal-body rod modification protein FlgD
MMAISGISSATGGSSASMGLDFQSLLKIILTQLTYQDPLKPVDNFEFISQLAQFSQLQQSQTLNDQVTNLLAAQSATQATSLLGKTVDVQSQSGLISGVVKAVSFATGEPRVSIEATGGTKLTGISIANIVQIR